jgi:hypothetical protein
MRRITTITGPDGKVTKITTRTSGCGCLTLLAAVVVVFGPIAWFPLPLAVVAYAITAVLLVAGAVSWNNRRTHGQSVPLPPPT